MQRAAEVATVSPEVHYEQSTSGAALDHIAQTLVPRNANQVQQAIYRMKQNQNKPNLPKQRIQCDVCGIDFRGKDTLKRHIIRFH